jgi:formylglycine-generating enzyme required for sulfatase activity
MKKALMISGFILAIAAAACDDKKSGNNSILPLLLLGGGKTFESATMPGDRVGVTAGNASFNMVYANNRDSITFPTGTDDAGTATLTRRFFIAETEVTNALFAAVLQYARDHNKLVETAGAHNEVSATTVRYAYQELIDLDYGDLIKINYSPASNRFSVASGYENHPVCTVTWYGAIAFCNWITEMRDGNTTNLVYSWVDNGDGGGTASNGIWEAGETDADTSKTGYRIPSKYEWEYAARYIGTSAPSTGDDLDAECVYYNKGGAFLALTPGYYWTPGDYASGASKNITNISETGAVAWYDDNSDSVHVVGTAGSGGTIPRTGNANALGIYDMSGNMGEWCFDAEGSERIIKGAHYDSPTDFLRTGRESTLAPEYISAYRGMRFARTK